MNRKIDLGFEDGDASSSIKSGGTANVVFAKLKDSRLIEKHQVTDVAVKLLHGNRNTDPEMFESFRYEIALMSALPESPYLVKLIGFSMDPMAIVMRRYSSSLQEFLDSSNIFNDDRTRRKAMTEIALGMGLVHSKNIIHFDLKPGTQEPRSQMIFILCIS